MKAVPESYPWGLVWDWSKKMWGFYLHKPMNRNLKYYFYKLTINNIGFATQSVVHKITIN